MQCSDHRKFQRLVVCDLKEMKLNNLGRCQSLPHIVLEGRGGSVSCERCLESPLSSICLPPEVNKDTRRFWNLFGLFFDLNRTVFLRASICLSPEVNKDTWRIWHIFGFFLDFQNRTVPCFYFDRLLFITMLCTLRKGPLVPISVTDLLCNLKGAAFATIGLQTSGNGSHECCAPAWLPT